MGPATWRLGLALPSIWSVQAAALLFLWRLLAVVARGDLATVPVSAWVIAVATDIALAQAIFGGVRLLAALDAGPIAANTDVSRNAGWAAFVAWTVMTLLRMAGVVHGALTQEPLAAGFWASALEGGGWWTNGAVFAALVFALASAALARIMISNDIEVLNRISRAPTRRQIVTWAGASLVGDLLLVALAVGNAGTESTRSAVQVPEVMAIRSLGWAVHERATRSAVEE